MNYRRSVCSAALIACLACAGCSETPRAHGPSAAAPAATVEQSVTKVAAKSEAPAEAKPAAEGGLLPPRDAAGVIDATFDDIKFDMEKTEQFKRSMLTPKINAMSGQPIRIRGWMLPTFRSRGLKEFVLVRDNQECCFGPGAALFDCILVRMAPGKTVEYPGNKQIAVEGLFRVEEYRLGAQTLAIYQMTGEAMN